MATKTLCVGNLPTSSTDAALATAFSAFGATNARVVEKRGFGYVDVEENQLQKAIQSMNGKRLDGHALTVSIAAPTVVAGIHRNEARKDRG